MNKNKEIVVVFGATGTLGTYLIDELIAQGYEVFACARRNIDQARYAAKGALRFGRYRRQIRFPGFAPRAGSRGGANCRGDAFPDVGV